MGIQGFLYIKKKRDFFPFFHMQFAFLFLHSVFMEEKGCCFYQYKYFPWKVILGH